MNKCKVSILFFICNIAFASMLDGAVMAQLQGVSADKTVQNCSVFVASKKGFYYDRDSYVSELASLHNMEPIKNFCYLALLPFCLITGFDGLTRNESYNESLVCTQKLNDQAEIDVRITTFPENSLHPKTYVHLRKVHFDLLRKKKEKPFPVCNISERKIMKIQQPLARGKK